jgi:hypothetical protein
MPGRTNITYNYDPLALASYDPNATHWNEADGIPWDEDTTLDLKAALEAGNSIKGIAVFLQYSEETVRAKIKELACESALPLVASEQPGRAVRPAGSRARLGASADRAASAQ